MPKSARAFLPRGRMDKNRLDRSPTRPRCCRNTSPLLAAQGWGAAHCGCSITQPRKRAAAYGRAPTPLSRLFPDDESGLSLNGRRAWSLAYPLGRWCGLKKQPRARSSFLRQRGEQNERPSRDGRDQRSRPGGKRDHRPARDHPRRERSQARFSVGAPHARDQILSLKFGT
jgi:hypothetical protein